METATITTTVLDAPAPMPEDSIGATVVYVDRGVYGFVEKRERVGIITGHKYCRISGQHFFVSSEGVQHSPPGS